MTSPAGFSHPGLPLFSSTPKRTVTTSSKHSRIDPVERLLGLNEDESKLFCQEEYVLFDDCEITYEIFEIILRLAEGYSRNKAVNNMLKNLNKTIKKTDSSISSSVTSFNRYVGKLDKHTENDRSIAMKEIMFKTDNAGFFDPNELQMGNIVAIKKGFVLTNEIFLNICRQQAKIKKLTWQSICRFVGAHLNLDNDPSPNSVHAVFTRLNSNVSKLSVGKRVEERTELLSTRFMLPSERIIESSNETQQSESSIDSMKELVEQYESELDNSTGIIKDLSKSLSDLSNSYEALMVETSSDAKHIEREYIVLTSKFQEMCKKVDKLQSELEEKKKELSKYDMRNMKKREQRKNESIANLGAQVKKLEKKLATYRKEHSSEKQKVAYYKRELQKEKTDKSKEELQELQGRLSYYENLTEELKEKVNTTDTEEIQTFMGGKYSDEVREIYYDLLRKNVSVENCGQIIKNVLEKLGGKKVGRLPKKSSAAEMMVEAQIVSKMQVHDAMLASTNNVLHTDGTKYKFNEIGSYQVTTDSGSYTLGIEEMLSGEASTYMETFRQLLNEISAFGSGKDGNSDENVRKILHNFKCLMTDRCAVNRPFFESFKNWRTEILPFVVQNYDKLPDKEKDLISQMHHVFCGLHVVHNLGIYAESALKEWEKVVSGEGSTHGGFKNSSNSRTYDLLFELSKLTSKGHGDQRNGKADEWLAYAEKIGVKNHMVSFLHHRFNIIFVMGGAAYFHRQNLRDFVFHLDSNNFLHESISQDIDSPVFLAAFRALGIFNKLISGPLFRKVEEEGHIFDLNSMWEALFSNLDQLSRDASTLMEGNLNFLNDLRRVDEVSDEVLKVTDDPTFETLTQECLEMICCTCSLMVKSQLADQLPGGKYHSPNERTLDETKNCSRTNIISERDFAQYDRRLSMKPTLSTIAACGVIMYGNNKTSEWLAEKSNDEVRNIVETAMKNKTSMIRQHREKRSQIMRHKTDMMEKKKLEKEIKQQKLITEKEAVAKEIEKHGGLWDTRDKAEVMLKNEKKKEDAIKCQIRYRKVVLGQTFPDRKLGQMGESDEGGKYVPYSITRLKENLLKIIAFSIKTPEERVRCFKAEIRKEGERKELLKLAKDDLQNKHSSTRSGSASSSKGRSNRTKKIPQFFGKTIRHKFEEEGKDVWYKGVVVSVLDDDEYATECEFEVIYEESDEKYEAKLVADYKRGWVVCEGRADKEWIKEHASDSKETSSVQASKRKASTNSESTPQRFSKRRAKKM